MRTRKIAFPAGVAVAVITAVSPASAALACGSQSTASSFQAAHHGGGGDRGDRGHRTHWRHWHGFYGIAGEVASYDADSGKLTVDTTSGTTISGTVTSKTKVWLDDSDNRSNSDKMASASVKAMHDDDGDDDATRAEALAALKQGVDVKVLFKKSGALAAVKIEK